MLGECAWPVRCESRAQNLECATHVRFTVRGAIASVLAAEVKILLLRVADRPAAIRGHKRLDRLSLVDRYVKVIVLRQYRGMFFAHHNAAYTKAKRQTCDYLEQRRSAQAQRNALFDCRQLRVIALVRAGRQKARAPFSSMACFSAESCIVEMRAFQIIEECIQFACIHVADVVPPPEALHDDAIAHGRRGLILEKGCLGLGYGNGLVISHRTTLARRDYTVDALVNTP